MQVIDAIGNAAVDSGEIDMRVIKIASEAKAYYYGGITFGGIALLILVLVVWQRKNIKTAVGMLQETARALRDMPFMKILPALPIVFLLILMAYSLTVACYLASIDNYSPMGSPSMWLAGAAGNSTHPSGMMGMLEKLQPTVIDYTGLGAGVNLRNETQVGRH
jgi:hypothetical protein